MINLSHETPFFGDCPQDPTPRQSEGAASPNTVTDDYSVFSKKSPVDQAEAAFVKAPQKFFGKFLEFNVAKRTTEEKEANQALRKEFHETLHHFFGPMLAEYLYPDEAHKKVFQEGVPLTPQQAHKIVTKGVEMMDVLAKYCQHYLDDEEENGLSQADRLDEAMLRYANEQEALASKESSTIGLLPHAAKVVGGGAMAAFAVATMGHLSPSDIFFLLDLLSSKKLSKGIEDFIKAKLMQHIEYHLESYLEEQRESRHPLSPQEEANLRHELNLTTESFNRESVSPTVKSEIIRAGDLSMEGGSDVHNPIEAVNYIFLSPLENITAGGAHNKLFRDGVTAVIENVKKIQDSLSKTEISMEELAKIKKAIAFASEGAGTWRDVEDEWPATVGIVASAKKQGTPFSRRWTRGI